MRNKKGFTLVELVIVIAVIAILAGVMIGTFASVVKKAQKSAEQQEMAAAKQEQTANDILAKLNNSNWLGWEDFEKSLAEKIGEQIEESRTAGVETIQIALQKAVEEFAKKANEGNTGLTEAQVQYIVENALAKNGTGVTEAQVRSIINSAVSSIATGATKAQIQAIVDAAQAKNLTAADVAKAIENAGLLKREDLKGLATEEQLAANKEAISKALADLQAAIEALDKKASTVTEEQIKAIIKQLMPVTETYTDATKFAEDAKTLNSGSTMVVGAADLELVIETTAEKTLIIKGENITSLKINAPSATVYVYNNVEKLDVEAAALESVHVYGAVRNVSIEQGRVVFEAGATVSGTVTVTSKKSVEIEVAAGVTVPEIAVTADSEVNVKLINNGTVAKLSNASTKATVVVENSKTGTITKKEGSNIADDVTSWKNISTLEGLERALQGTEGGNYKLTKSIEVDWDWNEKKVLSKATSSNVTIDMNGYNIDINCKNPKGGKTLVMLSDGKLEFTGKGAITIPNSSSYNEFFTFYVLGGAKGQTNPTLVIGKDVTVEGTIPVEITTGDGAYGVTVEVNGTLIGKETKDRATGVGVHVTADFNDLEKIENTTEVDKLDAVAPQITLGSTSVIKSYAIGIRPSGYAHWTLAGTIAPYGESTMFAALEMASGHFEITGGSYYSNKTNATDIAYGVEGGNKASGAAITLSSDKYDNIERGTKGWCDGLEKICPVLKVEISGGTFVSEHNYALLECISGSVKGSTLGSESVEKLLADRLKVGTDTRKFDTMNNWKDKDGYALDSDVSYAQLVITGGTFVSNAGKDAIKIVDSKTITNNGVAEGYALDKKTGTVSKTK